MILFVMDNLLSQEPFTNKKNQYPPIRSIKDSTIKTENALTFQKYSRAFQKQNEVLLDTSKNGSFLSYKKNTK